MELNKSLKRVIWIIGLAALLFATLNIHSRAGRFNYHSEIFSDKAGYYIYLPATFLYHFNTAAFPDSIEFKTGEGFAFDPNQNKIKTKYPCGVALLEMPFFIGAHIYCLLSNTVSDGFSRPYHTAIDIAAVFYVFAGFYFLFGFMKKYFSETHILISFALFLTGTNLFYYAVQETGLSHIYSFFLVSLFLYLYQKYLAEPTTKKLYILAVIVGMIILVRPINLVFFPFLLLLDFNDLSHLKQRFAIGWKQLFFFGLIVLLVLSPQLVYYFYQSGKLVTYSYENESFIYKYSPKILAVLFAFENGWFSNNPIHLFTLIGCILMIRNGNKNGWLALGLIITITYVYASWWSYKLGCALGHRGFVEFYAFLLIPFTFVVQQIQNLSNKSLKAVLYGLIFLTIIINMKLIYTYDGCWTGMNAWDIKQFSFLLFSPTK